jgi:hypothetical protein
MRQRASASARQAAARTHAEPKETTSVQGPVVDPAAESADNEAHVRDVEERSIARIAFEDASYFTFKRTLTKNPGDAFTVFILIVLLCLTVPYTASSRDSSIVESTQRSVMILADRCHLVAVQVMLIALVGTFCVAEHGARTGRWAWAQSLAARLKASEAVPNLTGFTCIVCTLRMSLHLLYFTTLDACVTPPPFTATIPMCNPSGMGLPSDRAALALTMPVLVFVFMPCMRLWAALFSWFIGCVCMALAYARIGVFVDAYNVVFIFCTLYMLVRADAFMWSAYQLHCSTLHEAARRESGLQRTRELEVALIEAEKKALQVSTSELRALMGNVAHDLKTPIQSISSGVELLRSECDHLQQAVQPCTESAGSSMHSMRHLMDVIWASCEFMMMAGSFEF